MSVYCHQRCELIRLNTTISLTTLVKNKNENCEHEEHGDMSPKGKKRRLSDRYHLLTHCAVCDRRFHDIETTAG